MFSSKDYLRLKSCSTKTYSMQRPDGYPSPPPGYPASPPAPRPQDVESWNEIHIPAQRIGGESIPLESVAVPTVVPVDVNGHGTYNPTQQPLPKFQKRAVWLRFPSSPWVATYSMYFFLVVGVCFAIGHHFFYSSLDGEIVDDQLRMLRWGTALAFACKASLTAAVLSAFDQKVWATVRTRFLTVVALDSMFAATENPLDMLNLELLTKAKMAVAMALFGWCAPAIVIITANTLLVAPPSFMHQDRMCRGVRSLNFDLEEAYTWPLGAGQEQSGLRPLNLATWNDTNRDLAKTIGYYNGPDEQLVSLGQASTVLRRPVTYANSTLETCERGWNCTVRVEMKGPGYNCTELGSGVGSEARNLSQQSGEISPPFNFTEVLLPLGNESYHGFVFEGEYSAPQMEKIDDEGRPTTRWPKNFAAIRTEPVVWIGYVKTAKGIERPLDPRRAGKDGDALIPTLMACEYYETQYMLEYQYVDGSQSIKVVKRTPLSPVVNTTVRRGVRDDETIDPTTATPQENYVLFGNTTQYKKTAAYHALGYIFRSVLRGTVEMPTVSAKSPALFTKVTSNGDYFPAENLQEVVPSLFEDMLFSLLSNQQWAAVVWAADMKKQVLFNEDSGEYPCRRSQPVSRYQYRAITLWAVYGVSVLLASLGVAAGTIALRHNGGLRRDSRFSSILAATRGHGLNRVEWGGPLFDRGQVNHSVRGFKMGYGTAKRDEAERLIGHQVPFTFGFEGEIEQKGNRHGN
ncbi:Hypothetical protein NCS54_00363300 [Fusarium falciforme]|uniref:Hypothetical protein n=1 Tax=Fusarium falciforme TaxID=195108 RepID=UPI0023000B5C|nr:Hypothetical protein NCS54_00363300 [Fusarium falciforme]WAO86361.1 Hypothetical protein NCS54_00363300 [Fusarium falciforme]